MINKRKMKYKIRFKLSHSLLSVFDKRHFFLTSFFIIFLTNILLAFAPNPAEINGDNPRFPIEKMAISGVIILAARLPIVARK
jgi:hypothetical protein